MANTIMISDGTTICKDWGSESGQPIVFSHGWPLDADAFEDQMFFLATHGYRYIGHGRSSQPWDGNDLDTHADDLAAVLEELDDVILVGHSTGGEVVRHIGCQGNGLVSKLVLISAIAPLTLKTDANLEGMPIEAFDELQVRAVEQRAILQGPVHAFLRI